MKESREIKLCGKRADSGEWVHGAYFDNGVKTYIITVDDNNSNDEEDFTLNEVIPETVGQFTNSHDIDKRDVYEGHVLQDKRGKKYLVKWGVNNAGFIAQTNETHCNVYSLYHLAPKTKIIGNIHDNPELMR